MTDEPQDDYATLEAADSGRRGFGAFAIAGIAGVAAAFLLYANGQENGGLVAPVSVGHTVTVNVTPPPHDPPRPPEPPVDPHSMPPQSLTTPHGIQMRVSFDHRSFLTKRPHDPDMLLTFTALGSGVGAAGDKKPEAVKAADKGKDTDSMGRNLVLALDTSGSMERGGAMAHLRTAALSIIDRLDKNDSLAIVTYSTSAGKVVAPASGADREALRAAIRSIEAVGGTNMSEGLEMAAGLARAAFREGGVNRILLFSDGKPTVGETDSTALLAWVRKSMPRGVTMSTFGLGAKFNEELLTAMADTAGGNYHYAGRPESLPAIFGAEIDYMGGKAVRNLMVSVFPQGGCDLAYAKMGTSMKTGDGWRFSLEALKPGETKKILAKVKFSDSVPGVRQLFSIKAQYETDGVEGPYLSDSLAACVYITDDSAAAAGSSDPEVEATMHLFELSARRREAARLLKENRRDLAIPILESSVSAFASTRTFPGGGNAAQGAGAVPGKINSVADEVRRIKADLEELRSSNSPSADQGMAKKLHYEDYKFMKQKNY